MCNVQDASKLYPRKNMYFFRKYIIRREWCFLFLCNETYSLKKHWLLLSKSLFFGDGSHQGPVFKLMNYG